MKTIMKTQTIIERDDCKPLSDNITGKLVVVNSKFFRPELEDAKYQLVLATGGFGCEADKLGNAVYVVECCENPENYRQERYNLIGEPTEELITAWKKMYGEFNGVVLAKLKEND